MTYTKVKLQKKKELKSLPSALIRCPDRDLVGLLPLPVEWPGHSDQPSPLSHLEILAGRSFFQWEPDHPLLCVGGSYSQNVVADRGILKDLGAKKLRARMSTRDMILNLRFWRVSSSLSSTIY